MFKLVILVEAQEDWLQFEQAWPQFLSKAEKMPGLQREVNSPIYTTLHGNIHVAMIHELYFNTQKDLRLAMSSPEGKEAGEILQTITKGKVTLLFADHLEDEFKNIQALEKPKIEGPPGDKA